MEGTLLLNHCRYLYSSFKSKPVLLIVLFTKGKADHKWKMNSSDIETMGDANQPHTGWKNECSEWGKQSKFPHSLSVNKRRCKM